MGSSAHIVGLVVPEAVDAIPAEAVAMYPQLLFRARGIGLKSLSTAGYNEAIERVALPAGYGRLLSGTSTAPGTSIGEART